jgi:hypothetical protein
MIFEILKHELKQKIDKINITEQMGFDLFDHIYLNLKKNQNTNNNIVKEWQLIYL